MLSPNCQHPAGERDVVYRTSDYVTGDRFTIEFCHACERMITQPTPKRTEIHRYYPEAYYGSGTRYNTLIERVLDVLYRHRARRFSRGLRPGRVLDVGCGRGQVLARLRELGWTPSGTELSETSARYARDTYQLDVRTVELEDAAFPADEFDLVILWHVLEHMYEPDALLTEIARVLKPGGRLVVAVPNLSSWEARMTGAGWFHLDVPRHLVHFSEPAVRKALGRVGLGVEEASYFSLEYDFFTFVQSFQNLLGIHRNLLFDMLRVRKAKVLGHHTASEHTPLEAVLAGTTAIPLGLASLGWVPAAAALQKGATVTLYASKAITTD